MNQLIAELDGFAEDLARDGAAGVETVASASQQLARLERENTELRNEIARLNNQTNWVCKCGGTDCEGQRENAALREDYRKLAKVISRTERSHAREVSFTKLQLGVAKSENAKLLADKKRLADAAEEVLNTYILTMREETGHPCPENLVICRELRAAIDAARKEAQL